MKITIISGSPRKYSNTQIMMQYIHDNVKLKHEVKFINLSKMKIEQYKGNDVEYSEETKLAVKDIIEADIWFIGSPIYNSFFSSALKNLFEFINYKKTEGKIAGLCILASGNIGFIYVQTMLIQLMTYFKVISNPKVVYMTDKMIKDNKITDNEAKDRLNDLINSTLSLAKIIKNNNNF